MVKAGCRLALPVNNLKLKNVFSQLPMHLMPGTSHLICASKISLYARQDCHKLYLLIFYYCCYYCEGILSAFLLFAGFVMSVIVSFPLMVYPLRTSLHSLIFQQVGDFGFIY